MTAETKALTAGARVRIVIETTVESLDTDMQLTNGVRIEYRDPAQLGLTVLEPGWQPGDMVDDGHGRMVRVDRGDGVHHWQRVEGGRIVYDDETSLASLRPIHRAALDAYAPAVGPQGRRTASSITDPELTALYDENDQLRAELDDMANAAARLAILTRQRAEKAEAERDRVRELAEQWIAPDILATLDGPDAPAEEQRP